ncbi:MAG: PLP-dependent transferase [Bdellovibrionaceae bacterium]|nr:PLP-dependent transferase [Pseudobdellovibrionaceae bacterium]NUM58540.1 PLP-dependent transferase [Pseudobdellovibrionaceae bacterium]
MKKIKNFFKNVDDFRNAIANEDKVFVYARGAEPSVEKFNQLLADYEGMETALSFSSGVAAISAVFFSLLKKDDHLIFHRHIYSWARHLIFNHCHKFGIKYTEIDESELPNIQKYILPATKMIYLENPSFYLFEVLELQNVFTIAKQNNILTVLDNSYLGPGNLKPHLQKFDIILHSATKIICGKGDAMGGVVCTNAQLRKIIFKEGLMSLGAVMTSQVAELLTLRMEDYRERTQRISLEMKKLLKFLNTQSQVKQVNYPWILDKNDNWIEHKDFYFPVGLLSFVIDCKDRNRIEKMVNSFETIKMGVSYGAKEALAIPSVLFAKPDESNQSIDLVRLSIGEEKAEKVIEDLEKSFKFL